MRRAVFCGRKKVALSALDYILEKGWDVLPVVGRKSEAAWMERPSFSQGLADRGIAAVTQPELLRAIDGTQTRGVAADFLKKPVDLVVSYLFPDRVQPLLLRLPRIAAINLHPGPLPEFGGLGGYSFAILENVKRYGVTAHHMDETYDTGDIILQEDFSYEPAQVTALDLERMTRPYVLSVFRKVIDLVDSEQPLSAIPQGNTRYVNKDEREAAKIIDLQRDDAELIDRKARAFWYPPYNGACFVADGKQFTVVPEQELDYLGKLVHEPHGEQLRQLPVTHPIVAPPASATASATLGARTNSAPATIRQSVADVINHILVDTGRERQEFHDDDQLMAGIGLDSLDLAVMTVSLERDLGVDPFREGRRAARNFAELVSVFEEELGKLP